MRDLSRGFTLIELLVVIAIVAIIASVAYPSFQSPITKTRRAEGKAALMQLLLLQERYYSQFNTYAAITPSPDETNFKWYSGNTPEASFYALSAAACPDSTLTECVLLSATPGTTLVNRAYKDPVCQTLTLDSRNQKGAAGRFVPDVPAECW
jgi:type IV pilus assembly protein PilE